jgi:hypothetical protein
MLDRVGDVHLIASNARRLQCGVEDSAGGTDERVAAPVFLVPGLLAHRHHGGGSRPFTANSLGREFPQVAASAILQPLSHKL